MDVFHNEKSLNKRLTITDVAQALGISKTTVSRAISGKGRVGEDTRHRVLKFIEENDYKPNVIAKGLAQQRTYNIALIIPGDCNLVDMPFFQNSMQGICQEASDKDYDVMLVTITQNDYSNLERMISNNKVDGVILSRSLVKDRAIDYLEKQNMPFVLMGTSLDKDILQVDNDHQTGCCKMVEKLINNGICKIGLIGGNSAFVVNRLRLQGYKDAFKASQNLFDERLIFNECTTREKVEKAVKKLMDKEVECIVCMDDEICMSVLQFATKLRMSIPQDIQVVSFYDSSLLMNNKPAVTSLVFDDRQLGKYTCSVLLKHIHGEEVRKKTLLGYEIALRESTKTF